jgi:hypothetical protein
MWPFKKTSSDRALKEFVDGLSQALGPTLKSVLVYGSKASGEYQEGRSGINLFYVVDDASWEALGRMSETVRRWHRAGHPLPVFIEEKELPGYAKSLPIEFLDMQDHHEVLFGPDPLQGLSVDRTHLRAQCLWELSVKQLALRQAVVLAEGSAKRLREVLTRSLPAVLTLCRAALRLVAEVPKGSKLSAAKELAKRAGFSADVLERLSEIHMRRETDNMADLARQYLACVERVAGYVGRS